MADPEGDLNNSSFLPYMISIGWQSANRLSRRTKVTFDFLASIYLSGNTF